MRPRALGRSMPAPSVEDADRLARGVLRQRLRVKPKENVTIETYPSSLPWATGFVREARRLGARPLLLYEDERSYWSAVEEGRAGLVGTPGAHEWAALKGSDVYIYFWGPENLARRGRLPDREAEKLVAFNSKWYQLAQKAGVRGARMGIARVTEANARFFGVPLGSWREQVVRASLRDPASIRPSATRLARRLARGRSVRIRHPNGTDLTLALAGREPLTSLGEVTAESMKTPFGSMANVPDASVYVAVDEGTADGQFVANRRTTSPSGSPIEGGRFTFRNGRLARSAFRRGGTGFRVPYRAAGVGRDLPSFLEVGLDPAVMGGPLIEESEAGAVTVGVGRNTFAGGKTAVDFFAYLTLGGAELSIDGQKIVRGGRVLGG
jgi:leucyl aminopeptidase (aminopeptidase T)